MSKKPPSPSNQAVESTGSNDFSQEMPSVTRLLNRKKLGITTQIQAPPRSAPPAAKPLTPPPAGIPRSAPPTPPRTAAPSPATEVPFSLEPVDEKTIVGSLAPVEETSLPLITQTMGLGLPQEPAIGVAAPLEPIAAETFDLAQFAGGLESLEAAQASAPAPIPTQAAAAPVGAPAGARIAKIQPAVRRSTGTASRKALTNWRLAELRASADAVERCAADLLDRGANSTLWMAAQPAAEGQQLPAFLASAGLSPPGRVALWTGMNWNPRSVPDLWNAMVRAGYLELGPPSGETLARASRTAVRKALGASPDEYLLLFRAGPANAALGILAVFAFKSLLSEADEVMARLNSSAAVARAA